MTREEHRQIVQSALSELGSLDYWPATNRRVWHRDFQAVCPADKEGEIHVVADRSSIDDNGMLFHECGLGFLLLADLQKLRPAEYVQAVKQAMYQSTGMLPSNV